MIIRAVYRAAVCLAGATALQGGMLTIGNPPAPGTGNCDPFGCPLFFGLSTYQQVYLSSAFPAEISIDGLTFFEGQVHNGGQPAGGTYTLSLSYTPLAPGALSLSSPGANIGSGSQVIFTGALPPLTPEGAAGNYLVFTGTPFTYNPADGNLLLTVTVSGSSESFPSLFLNEAACGPKTPCPPGSTLVSSNVYFGEVNGIPVSGGNDLGGLVTGFDYDTSATPEPRTLLTLLPALGLMLAARRLKLKYH